jgi:molecular chaperone DnaK (HSP70)
MKTNETIAIRAGDRVIPLVEAGTELPVTKRETLSTSRDDQESVRCELVAGDRRVAFMEVGVPRKPRGVAQVRLELRVSAEGSVHARLDGEDGMASASFSVATG